MGRSRLQGGFAMLVLSRKEGERLVIGDNITLVISKIAGNRVTIGIEAPKDVKIMRSELQTDEEVVPTVVKPVSNRARSSALKEFAGSVLTLKRQVG
jgi:carbon storage regulator